MGWRLVGVPLGYGVVVGRVPLGYGVVVGRVPLGYGVVVGRKMIPSSKATSLKGGEFLSITLEGPRCTDPLGR